MTHRILRELKSHAPFTALGALGGIVFMAFFWRIPSDFSYKVFYFLHPVHVFLSAIATASMYEVHHQKDFGKKSNFIKILLIGLVGSIGIGTLSDSLLPFLGEKMLGLPHSHAHIGFIEEWWLINPLALAGILIGYYRPLLKSPHSLHVFLSTWASLFHILMALGGDSFSLLLCIPLFFILFISVWVPCCTSDIIFPLWFLKEIPECDHSH